MLTWLNKQKKYVLKNQCILKPIDKKLAEKIQSVIRVISTKKTK